MAGYPPLSRRDFLARSTQAVATVGVGSLLAGQTARAAVRKIGANDRVIIGLIGCGMQGNHDIGQALGGDNTICAALCDIADFRMERSAGAFAPAMEKKGHTDVKMDRYSDYRKLLDRKDIDGVIIATPDHWHRPIFLAAIDADKHVYQEKPFSYTYEQGLEMVTAAKKKPELTVQIGTQRRSGRHYHKAKEYIDKGDLGKICRVEAFDTRNWFFGGDPFFPKEMPQGKIDWETFEQPCKNKHPYDPYRYFTWRWYWDYAGGLVTDVGIHVMDVVHWLTGNSEPKSVVANGGVYIYDKWETPDTVEAAWDYGTHLVTFKSNLSNERQGDGLTIFGTHRTMEIKGENIAVWEEGKRDEPVAEWPADNECHRQNWVNCIRSGKTPNAPVELGHTSLVPSHMANIAFRTGKKVTWDAQAQKIV